MLPRFSGAPAFQRAGRIWMAAFAASPSVKGRFFGTIANPPHGSLLSGKRRGRAKPCKKDKGPDGSDRQLLAATIAAAGKHPTAVLGAHAGTEAVNLIALALLGLKSTFHNGNNSF